MLAHDPRPEYVRKAKEAEELAADAHEPKARADWQRIADSYYDLKREWDVRFAS